MNTAAEMQRQREAQEREHHEERIRWLEGDAPRWACGTPVSSTDRHQLLQQSREALRQLRQN